MQGVRHKGRAFALQLLYQREIGQGLGAEELELFWRHSGAARKARDFATELVDATTARLPEIDRQLREVLENWRLERLSVVVRNLLRLAYCEMAIMRVSPFPVVIDEAVELARDFMDEDSARFVNGVLDKCHPADFTGAPPPPSSAKGG